MYIGSVCNICCWWHTWKYFQNLHINTVIFSLFERKRIWMTWLSIRRRYFPLVNISSFFFSLTQSAFVLYLPLMLTIKIKLLFILSICFPQRISAEEQTFKRGCRSLSFIHSPAVLFSEMHFNVRERKVKYMLISRWTGSDRGMIKFTEAGDVSMIIE